MKKKTLRIFKSFKVGIVVFFFEIKFHTAMILSELELNETIPIVTLFLIEEQKKLSSVFYLI